MTGDSVLIEAEGVSKVYRVGEISVSALKSVDLKVVRGEFTAVAGPSGSGKSTLLNILSGLDTPTAGRVSLAGTPISEMSGRVLSDFRRDHIGFIFQAFNLIPVLTVLENIEYILLLQGVSRRARRERVREMLSTVGLEGMEDRRPPQLSGGQQQRVAVARAMVSRPDLILADEPTANLDSATGGALLDLMRELNESRRMTFLFSSHDRMIMDRAKRLVVLRDGSLVQDVTRSGA
ncbi:MAG: ABC transporter ATP-binding protein [Candidatus Latescibacteria bacterium]|nr:ABC transporter ATP-binding protein [Candidatus Latescibacterota bacterium]